MALLEDLVEELKGQADVTDQNDPVFGLLETYLKRALVQHDRRLTFETLPKEEEELVVILAWAKVCLKRANSFAQDANISGANGFGTDRNTPYSKNMELANKLLLQYRTLCNQIAPGKEGRVIVGQIFVRDHFSDALVPLLESTEGPYIILSKTEQTASTITLSWTLEEASDFGTLYVFHRSGTDAIFQPWNVSSATSVRGVRDDATNLFSLRDPSIRCLKVEGLTFTAQNRFLLVVKTRSGHYAYSNELVVPAV